MTMYRVETNVVYYVEADNHKEAEERFNDVIDGAFAHGVSVHPEHGPVVDSILSADSVPADETDQYVLWDDEWVTVGEALLALEAD